MYSVPNIIWVKKSWMRWAGHVAQMGVGKYIWEFGGKNLKARCQLEDPGKDRRIILNQMFKKQDRNHWSQNRDM
jgi:hypothetical protein